MRQSVSKIPEENARNSRTINLKIQEWRNHSNISELKRKIIIRVFNLKNMSKNFIFKNLKNFI